MKLPNRDIISAKLSDLLIFERKVSDCQVAPEGDYRALAYASLLSAMIKVPTVSYAGQPIPEHLDEFHQLLEELFPLVHQNLEKTVIDGNLLYKWKGQSSIAPIVLMSHQDVVPAEGEWSHEPFSGDIADGKVWGRGASDTKCSVMAFFQAIEELLDEGYEPPCDVYISSSCTEEWGGNGCPTLVAHLKEQGVRPYLVCDEGGGIIAEPIGGISGKFAMIGVFEKGAATLRFTARSEGGHSSAPPKHTPIARLADFIHEVESRPVFKRQFEPEVQSMFESLGDYAPLGYKILFKNIRLFGPLMKTVMPAVSSQAAAMLQSTIAFTKASGADAYNTIPQEAYIGANMRFIPHEGMDKSLAKIRKLADKYDLEMEVLRANDYTTPVDINGEAFRMVEDVVAETFPGLACCPYVMTGATDARFFQEICDACVRFAPVVYGPEQMKGMHGLNENIEYNCLPGAVDFYKNLIRRQEIRKQTGDSEK